LLALSQVAAREAGLNLLFSEDLGFFAEEF
jgi:hypothetical protein